MAFLSGSNLLVNILDVEIKDLLERFKGRDRFEAMIQLQFEAARDRYKIKLPVDLNTKQGQKIFKDFVYCTVEELFEATNTLKNRAWTETEIPLDYNHFLDELSDALLFFAEMLASTGISAEKLFEIFLRKYKVNEFRENSNY